MKKINKLPLLLVAVLFLNLSFCLAQNESLKDFNWIIGTWRMPVKNGFLFEKWAKLNDSVFQSKAYRVKNSGDSVMMESVKIEYKNRSYYYTSTVPDQNNQLPVPFKITSFTKTGFVAENTEHDYPQRISYELKTDGSLYAFTDGKLKDKYMKNEFNYTKVDDVKDNSGIKIQEQNIVIVKNYFEQFNKHDWEKMAEFYSDPADFKDPSLGKGIVKQTLKQTAEKYKKLAEMSADIQDNIIQIYPSKDKYVIVEFVSSGTASNGIKWELPLCSIFTIEEGKITKDFTYYDNE